MKAFASVAGLSLLCGVVAAAGLETELHLEFPPVFRHASEAPKGVEFGWAGVLRRHLQDGQGHSIQVRYTDQLKLDSKNQTRFSDFLTKKLRAARWSQLQSEAVRVNGFQWLSWWGTPPVADHQHARILIRGMPSGMLAVIIQGPENSRPVLRELAKNIMLSATEQRIGNSRHQLRRLHKRAAGGEPSAMHDLAQYYHESRQPRDRAKAPYWYHKAAAGGHAPAMFSYGVLLFRGDGVPNDDKAALHWFTQAAMAGHKKAIFNVGVLYARQSPQDYFNAAVWIGLALQVADQGWQQQARHALAQATARLSPAEKERAQEQALKLKSKIFKH